MRSRFYTLTIKTSPQSATAFCLDASCDEDALGKALILLQKFDGFCESPTAEVLRGDGTLVPLLPRASQIVLKASGTLHA